MHGALLNDHAAGQNQSKHKSMHQRICSLSTNLHTWCHAARAKAQGADAVGLIEGCPVSHSVAQCRHNSAGVVCKICHQLLAQKASITVLKSEHDHKE